MNYLFKDNKYAYSLFLLPFFHPYGLKEYHFINRTLQIWKMISLVLIFIFIFNNYLRGKRRLMCKNVWGLVAFWGIYLVNCFVKGCDSFDIINNAITSILLYLFINYECANNRGKKILEAMKNIFIVYLIMQIISVICVKSGIYLFGSNQIYFMGTDNFSAFSIFPMLGILFIYQRAFQNTSKHKKRLMLLLVMLNVINILTWSVTFMISLLLVWIVFLCGNRLEWIIHKIKIYHIIIFYILVLIAINVFHIQEMFSVILEKFMGKGVDLNSRTTIWDCSISLIKEKWIFGHGEFSAAEIKSYILFGTTHAHNFLLELLLRTGIIGTIAYIVFIASSLKQKNAYGKSNLAYISKVFVYIQIMILFFMDFYPSMPVFYAFLGICNKIENLACKGDNNCGKSRSSNIKL